MLTFKQFLDRIDESSYTKKKKPLKDKYSWNDKEVSINKKGKDSKYSWNDKDVKITPKKKLDESTSIPGGLTKDLKYNYPIHPEQMDKFTEHHASLNPQHLQSLDTYKVDPSMNDNFRTKTELNDDVLKKHIKNLDHVTSKPTTHDIHAFRGYGRHATLLKNSKVGDVIHDKGYTSTSSSTAAAMTYSKDYNNVHIAHIHIPKGSKAHYASLKTGGKGDYNNNDEKEVLLHRGTKFQVTHPPTQHKDYVGDPVTVHHLKVIGHEHE